VSDETWLDHFDKDFTSMKPALDEDGKKFEGDKDPFKDWNWLRIWNR